MSRIAKRAFFLTEDERTRFVERMWSVAKFSEDGSKQPSELRNALGIASANFFTARYLTPLTKAGYIAIECGVKKLFFPTKKYKLLRQGRSVVNA